MRHPILLCFALSLAAACSDAEQTTCSSVPTDSCSSDDDCAPGLECRLPRGGPDAPQRTDLPCACWPLPSQVDCEALAAECSRLDEDQCEQREDCFAYRTWRYEGGDLETCLSQPVEAKEFVSCEAGGEFCGIGFFATAACIWRAADPQRCWCDGNLLAVAESNPDWGWAQACRPTDATGDAKNPCGWEPGSGGTSGAGGEGGAAGAGGMSGSGGSP